MKTVTHKMAAITGAASGIGRMTALGLANRRCDLALCDVDEEGLEVTARQCRERDVKVTIARVDVGDRNAVEGWARDTVLAHGPVNILINNAGVAATSSIENFEYEDFEWVMRVNFWGVVYGTKAFLPHIKRSGDGHIVNVSSVFGLVAVPTQAAYHASKFAVRGFTECLSEELAVEGCKVGVTCAFPGFVKTNFVRNARMKAGAEWGVENPAKAAADFEKAARTTPEEAAEAIIGAILRNQRRVVIGVDAKMLDLMQRFMPAGYVGIVASGAKRQTAKGGDTPQS